MGALSNGLVWCGSKKEVDLSDHNQIGNINCILQIHLYKFQTCDTDMWAYANCKIVRFFASEAADKKKLIVTIGDDSNRILR